MNWFKTKAAAEQLGLNYWQLYELLRSNRITPPAKDSSGDFVWTPEDVERARAALAALRRRKPEPARG